MPQPGDVHVVPSATGWLVEVENDGPNGSYDTQDGAWEAAKEIAQLNKAEAILHAQDGTIRERNTYRGDPRDVAG